MIPEARPYSSTSALSTLVLSMFNEGELRIFLADSGFPEVLEGVPSEARSPAHFVTEVVGALCRRGRLGWSFFEALRRVRPHRASEIAQIAASFDATISLTPIASRARRFIELHLPDRPTAGWPRRLLVGEQIILGRGGDDLVDAPLADAAMSRRHAKIGWGTHGAEICDLGSKNGTFVNGVRVLHAIIRDGDNVRLGETTIVAIDPDATDTLDSR